MSFQLSRMLLIGSLLLGTELYSTTSSAAPVPIPSSKKGNGGLPPGAIRRLGTSQRFRSGRPIVVSRITPDGKHAFVRTHQQGVLMVDLNAGKVVHKKEGIGPFAARGMGVSPDGKFLLCLGTRQGAEIQKIELWNIEKKQVHQILTSAFYPSNFAFSPDSRFLALGEGKGREPGVVSLWDVKTGKNIRTLDVAQNLSIRAAFSFDSKYLATWGGNYSTQGDKKKKDTSCVIQIWEVKTGKKLRELISTETEKRVEAVAFSPDNKQLAVVHWASSLEIWDFQKGKIIRTFGHQIDTHRRLRFSPDGKYLMGHTASKGVQVWDTETWKEKGIYGGRTESIVDFTFTNEGIQALVSEGMTLASRDLFQKRTWTASKGHRQAVRSLSYISDSAILSADGGAQVIFWDLPKGDPLNSWNFATKIPSVVRRVENYFRGTVLSPDGLYLAAFNRGNRRIHVWSLGRNRQVTSFPGPLHFHEGGLSFSMDGKLAYMTKDLRDKTDPGIVYVWGVKNKKELHAIELPKPENEDLKRFGYSSVRFSRDGSNTLVVASQYNLRGAVGTEIFFYDTKTGKLILQTLQKVSYTPTLAFSPDNEILAMGGSKEGMVLLHPLTGKEFRCEGIGQALNAVACSPDGRVIVGSSWSSQDKSATIHVWERHTRKIRFTFKGHTGQVHSLAFSPDGKILASAGVDSLIYLWDMTGQNQFISREPLTKEDLNVLWSQLTKENARKAFFALRQFSLHPRETVAYLKSQLDVDSKESLTPEKIRQLIADLDSRKFQTREKASEALRAAGSSVVSELKKTLEKEISLEVRVRISRVLHTIEAQKRKPSQLRQLRAIEVLENIGDKESLKLLQGLAKGGKDLALTKEAKAALQRLNKE